MPSPPATSALLPSPSPSSILPAFHRLLPFRSIPNKELVLRIRRLNPTPATPLLSSEPRRSRAMISSSFSSSCSGAGDPDATPAETAVPRTAVVPQDSLLYSRAYWVSRSLIAWDTDANDADIYLYASRGAGLSISADDLEGYDVKIQLEREHLGLPPTVTDKFPHISSYAAYKVPESVDVVSLLKCQLAVASFSAADKCIKLTGVQLPGVIDDLFSYNGPLGALFSEESVSLYLWAPTAHFVRAYIYKDAMVEDSMDCVELEELNGVWRITGPKSWLGCYYVYEVAVYHPSTLQIENCRVNDPYARGLSADGKRTLLVNLDDNNLKPVGWNDLANEKPVVSSFNDVSIYELHIRDFSAEDETVNPDFRGGFLAFTCQDSNGALHLRRLSDAGLTHVHLLPSFHFGGVNDERDKWKFVDHASLVKLPPDSDQQQAEVMAIKDEDGYNWGYNPILWGVPKGSYASNPNGPSRTFECRSMVQALNRMGLRVILDVVYNHVQGNGPLSDDSVLDKVVPGYYLRRNKDGFIENSTCMNNTASEHFMMERLILDDLLCWAIHYKVDGFRFDLMGHIMKKTMVKAKSALQALSKERDGVDGPQIYLYGEGWDFGEVAQNGRGVNASQFNISGTGIGSFNDRLRDAVLGGSPFGNPLQQGFVTGLSLQPNGYDHGDKRTTEAMLAAAGDHIQVGLAANLRDFVFTGHEGKAIKGCEVLTHDNLPVAYASCPTETVNYVSAHDNESLFDIISLKTAVEINVEERCRINTLASSLVALSQGIPFFHAGDEILRSKSLDRDSYNSGDWFNRLDFTYESNNWGVGLPPKEKNEKNWPLIKPRLEDPSFKPLKNHILSSLQNFEDLLKIRYSSPLFRLDTANSIQERVRFHNTGPNWIPGIIAMSIEDGYDGMPGMSQLDQNYSYILVIFNVRPTEASLIIPSLRARSFELHTVQLSSCDKFVKDSKYVASSGCFTIPHRTTAVFVEARSI